MKTKTTQRRNPAQTAVRLVARHLLEALRNANWDEWKKAHMENHEKLDKTVAILARISRELRADQAEHDKRAPTIEEIEEIERRLNLL
jgi:hypothetical protein